MDMLPAELLQYAPAVVVLMYLNFRQAAQIDRLVGMIVDCYTFHDDDSK